ncbi:hypothetical protein V6N13_064301 [Hibiscus sabdariffa]
MELFHEISQNGPTPDIVTYNTLMQAFFIGMAVPCQLEPVFSTTESESSTQQRSTAKSSTFHSLKAEAIGRSQSTTPVVASFVLSLLKMLMI